MGRVKATNQDDLDLPNYNSDGKSSVDVNETTPQLPGPDGESSIEVGEYAGADRATESVQGNVPEFKETPKSEKIAGSENLTTDTPDDADKAEGEKPAARRGRKSADSTEKPAAEEKPSTDGTSATPAQ